MNLYTLSPLHFSLIEPLVRWRILRLEHILEITGAMGRTSNFYKKIKQLELQDYIEASLEPYTGRKYIYLTRKGLDHFAQPQKWIVNGNNIHHDSLVSDLLFDFKGYPFCKKMVTEVEMLGEEALLSFRPDGYFEGFFKKEFRMALEIELSMKSKERLREIFMHYSRSNYFNNVLYLFAGREVYEFYQRALKEFGDAVDSSKFLLLYMPTMHRRIFNSLSCEVSFRGEKTTLGKLFEVLDVPLPEAVHWQGNEWGMPSTAFYRSALTPQN